MNFFGGGVGGANWKKNEFSVNVILKRGETI